MTTTAEESQPFDHKATRDGFGSMIEWIREYRARTKSTLKASRDAYNADLPMPSDRPQSIRQILSVMALSGDPVALIPACADLIETVFAAALAQAQNDKLEEAALWFEDQSKMTREAVSGLGLPAALTGPISEIMDGIPADLRSLKKD
jgi:hypothetical protein